MQNWKDLYTELADKIKQTIPDILWIDLWHDQVGYLEDEHPFSTPAVFLAFRTGAVKDMGAKQQEVALQVEFYLFYETFADTYHAGVNKDYALRFLELMDAIHGNFHATSGQNYSAMRRVGFNKEDSGGTGNLYRISFTCLLQDTGAMKYMEDGKVVAVELVDDSAENGFKLY